MEGVSILEKQDNHNSKHTIDSLKTKRRENQYNTAQNQTTKGKRQRRNVKSMGKQEWQYISIITLNANGLNAPFKRHRLDFFFFFKEPTMFCLQETHSRAKDTHRLKMRG